MKKVFYAFIILLTAGVSFYAGWAAKATPKATIPEAIKTVIPKPFERYTIENLAQKNLSYSELILSDPIENKTFTSYIYTMVFDPTLETGEQKKVTGLVNIPQKEGAFPAIVMIRGYVDQTIYQTGVGTSKAGEYFAENGFITIAPDFLGYAGSDSESGNIFETRFQTYTTVLQTIATLQSIKEWNQADVGIWAHSNGGQIALTVLAVTGKAYPTTLWAPVTKPFPYSVLYYTDESADGGKLIRRELAKFEDLYDVDKYSFTNYLDRINAPMQLHQGTLDDAIPVEWSDKLVNTLKNQDQDQDKEENNEIIFYIYPGADHNLRPDWNTVVERDLAFFKKNFNTDGQKIDN